MKNKKSLIISIIAIIIITIIVIIVINISKSTKETKNNLKVIKTEYQKLSTEIDEYNSYREEYNKITKDLYIDNYKEVADKLSELFTNYNKTMSKIDSSILSIAPRCNHLYKDSEINKICNNYEVLYEKLVNLYVSDAKSYNNIIVKYNETAENKISEFDAEYKEYIDYNKDGIYEGRDNSETD